MSEKSSKCNYTTKPIPSAPGAQQITADALKSKKGSSDFNSKLPTQNLIPGDKKSK